MSINTVVETETVIPKPPKVKFTKELIASQASRKRLVTGTYRFIISKAWTEASQNTGSLMLVMNMHPLTDPDDGNSGINQAVRNYVVLPFPNDEWPAHKIPNTGGLVAQFLRAIYPDEIPEMPKTEGGQLKFQGEVISREDEDYYRNEVMEQVFIKAQALYEGEVNDLEEQAVYADVYYQPDRPDWPSLRDFSAELKEGKSLVPADQFYATTFVAPAEPTNGKVKANGKATKKAPAKKKKK